MKRVFCTVLVVTALTFSAAPAGAREATVETIEVPTLVSQFPDDGGPCTGVPDTIPGIFDFTDACTHHDACYASGEQTQAQCDQAFRQDMVAACLVQHPSALDGRRYACLTAAQLYYAGVRLFSQFFI